MVSAPTMTNGSPGDTDVVTEHEYLPTESQLTLFCLDYLRDLRRTYSDPQDLLDAEGLHADWLTLAIHALGRSFSMQGPLKKTSGRGNSHEDVPVNYNQVTMPVFNDSWMDSHRVLTEASPNEQEEMMNPTGSPPEDMSNLPPLQEMTNQILLSENPFVDEHEKGEKKNDSNPNGVLDSYTWYEYDDAHPSNANRFFLLNGLSGSVNGRGPLLLGEVAAAGLCQLKAKARLVAEDDMIRTPLFEQFVHAVDGKGFFEDPEHETPRDDPQQEEERMVLQKAVYDERMGKVVSKFRSKLASKMEPPGADGDDPSQDAMTSGVTTYLADYHHGRRMKGVVRARKQRLKDSKPRAPSPAAPIVPAPSPSPDIARMDPSVAEAGSQAEAESLKSRGNAYMQKKEYKAALECYTQSLKLCPSGPQSHVYFSNRAAALLSMKMFDQAILDSERALSLAPTYGKAHARLGLAHFLLGDYRRAMEAYTVALKYEPDNRSSKSYLEKAAKKLAAMGQADVPDTATPMSYSVVSEWEKSNINKLGGGKSPNISNSDSFASNTEPKKDKKSKENKKKKLLGLPGVSNEAAEKHKTLGNTQMADRQYQSALESYSNALGLSPDGPQSHVYYSNRAAALCYLERYEEAVNDSEAAIALIPTYGKAYARLGLSRFFMNDFEGSIVAYKTALSHDPNNAASKSYLGKAQHKLERQKLEEQNSSTEARRMMEDPDMIHLARKMMKNNGKGSNFNPSEAELLADPEMRNFARKAMNPKAYQ
jgi:tetratricopeptide (TPR) repeat protein